MATADLFSAALESGNCLAESLELHIQNYIKLNFWPGSANSLSEFVLYFRYFQWSIGVLLWPNIALERVNFVVQNYGDLATVVHCINNHRDEARGAIATKLRDYFPGATEDRVLRSMDLAIRLWMTLHIRSNDLPVGPLLSDVTFLDWGKEQSLSDLVSSAFPRCKTDLDLRTAGEARIDPAFTIMNLRKICRVRVDWTSNLKDHLRFDRSTRNLYIYPHKICLLNHFEHCNVFPKEFLLETVRTLDLLFPFGDKNTESWLEASKQPFHRTSSSYVQARATDLTEFCYWRRQLLELYDLFQQPPSTMTQMWHDRRNPMQWYTFWLAAFIAISSLIFGSIGCYIGFRQISLAERSIQISLAQMN